MISTGARTVLRVLLALWSLALLATGAALLAGHLVALPKPHYDDSRLTSTLARMRNHRPSGRVVVIHILDVDCRCSQRVLEHLVARRALPGVEERVVLVGPEGLEGPRVSSSGFELEVVTRSGLLARYGVLSAPVMVVADGQSRVQYIGGYTLRKQATAMRDAEIIARIARGEEVEPLPLFGCAVDAKLRETVDPLRLLN